MLIEFTVGNFRSFREKVTLSMVATRLRGASPDVDANALIPLGSKHHLLKVAVIFGANAGGKSNLVLALASMRRFVLRSVQESPGGAPPAQPFLLDNESAKHPSFFEIVFITGDVQYRYGFEIDRVQVVREWLFTLGKKKERVLFERDTSGIRLGSAFTEGQNLEQRTRREALFVSVCAQFNGTHSMRVLTALRDDVRVVFGINDLLGSVAPMWELTARILHGSARPELRDRVLGLLRGADLGIRDYQVEYESMESTLPTDMPTPMRELLVQFGPKDVPKIRAVHQVASDGEREAALTALDFDEHESDGTRKLFALAGPVLDVLSSGRVLVIDELDARLHPLLTAAVVDLFQSSEHNPNNAQLIFTTHDALLLDFRRFRRDQIWFVEKDVHAATRLISLAEFRGVRKGEAFLDGYLRGRYGAIPILRDFVVDHGEE